jgi:hypothetical protein
MPRSIAKVNARSIDGYFGVGTSCFFIRGTVLSDTAVGGEYLTLNFNRAGNVIEIEAFDGLWAVVSIHTREGNRPGDNIQARIYLRDDDLKSLGIDCAKIAAYNGLPFAFGIETLTAHGIVDPADHEGYEPVEDDPPPPPVAVEPLEAVSWSEPEPEPEPEPEAVYLAPESDEPIAVYIDPEPEPELEPEPLPEPEPEPMPEPEPEPEPEPQAQVAVTHELVAALAEAPPEVLEEAIAVALNPLPAAAKPAGRLDLLRLIAAVRGGTSGKQLLEIGGAVAAVAAPVAIYLLLAFLRNTKKPPDDKLPG